MDTSVPAEVFSDTGIHIIMNERMEEVEMVRTRYIF